MSTDGPPIKVLYFNHGGRDLYDLVRRSALPGIEIVTLETGSVEERLAKIADCEAVIVGGLRLDRRYIEAARRLRLVHHQGVGYHDTVDTAALRERQIQLAIAPGGTSVGVAEHTLMMMLAVGKRLAYVDAELRQGRWHANDLRAESHQLSGATVGIVGLGRIGKAIARRAEAFNLTVAYHGRNRQPGVAYRYYADPVSLAKDADILMVVTPGGPGTRHLINAAVLDALGPKGIFINVARGSVVDQPALVAALKDGRIAAAGLDVFETEPCVPEGLVDMLDNVVLQPHQASASHETRGAMGDLIIANVQAFLAGKPPLTPVTVA